MKKVGLIFMLVLGLALTGCDQTSDIKCGAGTVAVDGKCVAPSSVTCDEGFINENGTCVPEVVTCNPGYHEENGNCVPDAVTCDPGYIEENGSCVPEEVTCNPGYHEENGVCVLDEVVESPDWFDGWTLLQEPLGNKSLNEYVFTETGYSVTLTPDQRTGIQLPNFELEPGFSYELRFNYSADVPGRLLFAQLQGHGGHVFTSSAININDTVESFSQTLPYPPEAPLQTNGWLTLEILPGGTTATVTITDIEIIKTALPECAANEELDGLVCIPANNGYTPNGTPTAWFTGWQILTVPAGNKEISDLDFTETGYTVYLGEGDRSGIELLDYEFEPGYSYELTFNYTASVAGRLVWVQMEALGGYGFTNTDTWTVNGTGTFSQTLEIPSTYNPVENGWIKLELAPGVLDNITIDNIEIIKTPLN